MSTTEILILATVFAVTWAVTTSWKAWLARKLLEKQIEQRVELSKLEREKMALIVRSMADAMLEARK